MQAEQFFSDFKTNVENQYEECEGYKLLCKNQAYNPNRHLKSEADIENVPFITTTLFKKSNNLYQNLLRVNIENIEKWTVSSSTSGDPSIVGRTKNDITQLKELVKLDRATFKPNSGQECVFFPNPLTMRTYGSEKILGKSTESYIGNLLDIFDFSADSTFLLKATDNGYQLDVDEFVRFIKKHDGCNNRVSIRGSTLLLFKTIMKLKEIMPPVCLGDNAMIHTGGGGWDGKKGTVSFDKVIERRLFVEEVSDFLGISPKNFIDTYSFTENSTPITGHYSEKYHDYLFHVPPWSRVIIRDVKTMLPVFGESARGFIEVLNAYGTNAFAGAAILVDDIAEVVSEEKCPDCGAECRVIRIIGRVKGAEAKGCGATLSVRSDA